MASLVVAAAATASTSGGSLRGSPSLLLPVPGQQQRRNACPLLRRRPPPRSHRRLPSLFTTAAAAAAGGGAGGGFPWLPSRRPRRTPSSASSAAGTPSYPASASGGPAEPSSRELLEAVARRVGKAAQAFNKLGYLSFWSQLVLSVVSAVVLVFSIAFGTQGQQLNPQQRASANTFGSVAGLYLTAAGLAAAFLSVFWAFGYTRLAQRLHLKVTKPKQGPNRADVIRNLTNGIYINMVGLASSVLGAEAVVGLLVAKTLTSPASPLVGGGAGAYSPVLALDVFLVQASANTVAAHFIGLAISLWLLRLVLKDDEAAKLAASASASSSATTSGGTVRGGGVTS
eukprot:jgi/Chlat1/4630/Chrsp3S05589